MSSPRIPETKSHALVAASQWLERGYLVVPVPYQKKKPVLREWQKLRLKKPDLPKFFNGQTNIGVLQGEPYGNADVDLDCAETLAAWREFAPDTGLIFGRPSKPASHYFYRTDPPVRAVAYKDKYSDPVTTLVELRGLKTNGEVGLQTVVPPSTHESGELLRFDADGIPANVDADVLKQAVARTAAAALLARHWPGEHGGRHDAFLHLAGALAHADWSKDDALVFVRAIYRALWRGQADFAAAEREVSYTFDRVRAGQPATGLPKLTTCLNAEVINQATRWLELRKEQTAAPIVAKIYLNQLPADMNALNSLEVLHGMIRFASAEALDSMIRLTTEEGVEIVFPTATHLNNFTKARDIISARTGIFLPTPGHRQIKSEWEPFAALVYRMVKPGQIRLDDPLKEETRNNLRMMWRRTGQPVAANNREFIARVRLCKTTKRDTSLERMAPPSVFVFEEGCVVYVPSLQQWLYTPQFVNKLYSLKEIRDGLLLLKFTYHENLTRRHEGDSETACLWFGPLDVLSEEDDEQHAD